jgi:hypothetical protein
VSAETVVITGGTGKLGRVLVADRLQRGDTVVALGARAASTAELLRQHADATVAKRLSVIACDLTAAVSVQSVISKLLQDGLQPTALVHAARSLSHLRTAPDGVVAREDFSAELMLNVVACYDLTMALALAPDSRLANVVCIGSQYGVVAPNPALYADFPKQSFVHYGVAKAALIHLSRELAVRLAPRIRVNCISFGGVEGRADADFAARYARLAPMGRMLRDTEISGPVNFLLSDASSGTTGHNLIVDGGWSAW